MGLVLWIDQNAFASNLIEKVFKKKGLEFYTIPHARDFSYLVEDLTPALIVIDSATIRPDIEVFRNQYEASEKLRNTPTVAIGGWTGLEFVAMKQGELPRTLDPFQVPEILKALLN